MDYAWEYLSVAVQHGLNYVKLDDRINLGNYEFDDLYKQAEVRVTGKEPGSWITRTGKSCTYGVTMVKDAPNAQAAALFLEYMLRPDGGLKILQEMGQPPFIPCRVAGEAEKGKLPDNLKALVDIAR